MNKLNKIFLLIILILIIGLGFMSYKMMYWKNNSKKIFQQFYESNERIEKLENEYNRSINNVIIEIDKSSITSKTATITITDNNEYPYTYREDFYVQAKQEDGTFKDLELISNTNFNQTPYKLDKNNQIVQNLDWSNMYGSLPKGTYRIVKYIYTSNNDIYLESNEFEIK